MAGLAALVSPGNFKARKKEPERMKQVPKMWSKLLAWQIEVARGMERLESLNIVHRDLAAR